MTICFRSEPGTHTLLLLCTTEAEDMLAWNHSAVDQDRFQALVAAVDHWVHNLLSNQVDLVQKVKVKIYKLCKDWDLEHW